jgi:bifunctional non-homologous end joining protein LigD
MAMHWSAPRRTGLTPTGFIEPCLPTQVDKPPSGPEWLHEIKHDGYRLLVRKRDGRVRLFTRGGFDWTHKFPLITDALAALRAHSIMIDGEAVWCDPKTGLAIFDKLQSQANNDAVFLYAFDLLELDGIDWRTEPLEARKTVLAALLSRARAGLRFNGHLAEDGTIVFRHACKLGAEGIVSKRRDMFYRSGRSKNWLKTKNPKSPAVHRIENGTSW